MDRRPNGFWPQLLAKIGTPEQVAKLTQEQLYYRVCDLTGETLSSFSCRHARLAYLRHYLGKDTNERKTCPRTISKPKGRQGLAKKRKCLGGCDKTFLSTWEGHRICDHCKISMREQDLANSLAA